MDANGEIRKDTADTLQLMSPENQNAEPAATTNVTLSGNIDSKDKQVTYSADGAGYPISVSFYDNVGNLFTAKLSVMKANATTDNEYTVGITDIMDSKGNSILKKGDCGCQDGNTVYSTTNQYVSFGGQSPLNYTVDPDGTITFTKSTSLLTFNGSSGEFVSVSGEVEGMLNLTLNDGNTANNAFPVGGVNIDFSGLTMYATKGTSTVKPERGDADGHNAGNAAGTLNGFSIGTDGKIYAVYSNGDDLNCFGQIGSSDVC